MEKPVLSPDFTIDDIHKLREYNYYLTKDMTPQERMDEKMYLTNICSCDKVRKNKRTHVRRKGEERMDYYNKKGRAFQQEIEESKLQKV